MTEEILQSIGGTVRPGTPMRILLVEDNPGDVRLVREALADVDGFDFHLRDAGRMDEALSLLKESTFDVVLLDLGLPDSEGLGTLRRLQSQDPDLAVVVLTGSADEALAASAVSHGAQDYLTKAEMSGQDLARALRYALLRKRAGDAVRESEERFRSIFENVPVGVYRRGADGRFLLANVSLLQMLGCASRKDLERAFSRDEGARSARADFLRRLERDGEVKGFETALRRPDGTTIHVRESARAVRGLDGALAYYEGIVEDISERKTAEARLLELKTLHEGTVENVPAGVLYMNAQGIIIYENRYLLRILGAGEGEDPKGWFRSILELETVKAHPEFVEKLQGVLRGEPFHDFDLPYRSLYGKDVVLSVSGVPVLSANAEEAGTAQGSRVKGALLLVQDVTERRRAEEKFRGLLEGAPDALVIVDGTSRIVLVNTQAERLFGYPREEIVGKPIKLLIPDRFRLWDPSRVGTHPAESPAPSQGVRLAMYGRRRDGIEFPVEVTLSPLRTESGILVMSAIRDVSDRERAEEALRESEERFRVLVEKSTDIITILKPDGTIRFESPAVEGILGYEVAELLEQNAFDYVHPDDVTAARDAIAGCLGEPGNVRSVEFRFRHKDGSWRHLEAVGTNLTDTPGIQGVLVLSRDVTGFIREREAAAQREVAARAERLAALGVLVAGVAHEVNNPLVYVRGNIDTTVRELERLREDLQGVGVRPSVDLARLCQRLKSALAGADSIARVVKALRVVARQDAGPRGPLDLNDVLRDVEALMRASIPPDIHAGFEAAPSAVRVAASAPEIHQVLLNLAKNAAEALEGTKGNIHVSVAREGDEAVIRVSDDGPGIAPDVQAQLFTPFLTTKPGGTGLGLPIIHSIVKDHGGTIDVKTAPGKGTVFLIRLPLFEAGASSAGGEPGA